MKHKQLIITLLLSWAAANAQDKIITVKHDTIQCRIISIRTNRIFYEQKTADNQIAGKSIKMFSVLQYLRTEKPDSLGDKIASPKARRERPEHRWLFSLQGGMAYSLTDYTNFRNYLLSSGNTASNVDDYLKKLKNGYHVGASFHYLLTSHVGLGADYTLYDAASKGEFLTQTYGFSNVPLYAKQKVDERLYTSFAGASFLFRQFPDTKKKLTISETLSPGIVLFRNESRDIEYMTYWGDNDFYSGQPPQYYGPANSITTSRPFAAKGSLALDYAITPHLSAGLAGNYMWAKLHKVSIKYPVSSMDDQKLQKPVDISHIGYGFIVRYNF